MIAYAILKGCRLGILLKETGNRRDITNLVKHQLIEAEVN